MTGHEKKKKSVFLQKFLNSWGQGCWKFVINLKLLLMLDILRHQRKLEFIILQSGSAGNTPELDLKMVLRSFCNPLESFCFSQAGIQDSPQDYSLHVAFHEREMNLHRKSLSYFSLLTCISSDCNFYASQCHISFTRSIRWISSATTTIHVT